MPNCLIVSPHFPPSTLAGVHRARHLAKHLPAHGWEPVVIAVDPAQHVEAKDPKQRRLVLGAQVRRSQSTRLSALQQNAREFALGETDMVAAINRQAGALNAHLSGLRTCIEQTQ